MSFDAHANFAQSSVSTPPSPALSGTSLHVLPTTGSQFPATPFNASAWPNGSVPSDYNTEIVRVTNITGDVLTIVRAQEGTTAQPIDTTYVVGASVTVKTLTDIESAVATATAGVTSLGAAIGYLEEFIASSSGPVVVANSSAQTTLSSISIPGGTAGAGQTYKYNVFGTFSTTGTPTLTFYAMFGGTAGTQLVATPAITTPSGATNYSYNAELTVFFISSTQVTCALKGSINTAANTVATGTAYFDVPTALVTVNTTSTQSLELDVKWGTASASNTLTAYSINQRLV